MLVSLVAFIVKLLVFLVVFGSNLWRVHSSVVIDLRGRQCLLCAGSFDAVACAFHVCGFALAACSVVP